MERLFKAKHWQIFLIAFGIPLLLYFSSIILTVGQFKMKLMLILMFFALVLFLGGYLSWLWSMGVSLQKRIPEQLQISTLLFRIFLFFPVVYYLGLIAFFRWGFGYFASNIASHSMANLLWILPLHLFAIFCFIYCIYFAARVFKTAELMKKVSFTEFAGEFALIWIFPVGIWILQPKINKMVQNTE